MIEYEYEELFANHSRVDLLIVESGASLEWNSTTNKFDVTDSDFVITNEEIDSESFDLDERLCSNEDLKFGKCEAAHLSFTIYNRTTIPNLKDSVIAVFFYFNNDPSTIFPVGVYVVDEDNYTGGRQQRDISAYDWNYTLGDLDITPWYDKYFETYNSSSIYRQIIYVIADLFKWIRGDSPYNGTDSVSKASPELPIEVDSNYTLTNGTFAINKTIESDTITFDMFMEGLLEFNGCFGHINRQGKFQMVKMEFYTVDPVRIVTDETRMPPTNYDDVATWGIGQIDVYDRDNVRKFRVRNTDKKYPSTYVMVDPWILADRDSGDSTVQEALVRMQKAIWHFNYTSCEVDCIGDLCVEVGDRIDVRFNQPEEWDTKNKFRSYVLERHFSGIQGMFDTYTAKGHKKQPKYKVTNDRWHEGDSSAGTTGSGTGNVAEVIDEIDNKIIEIMRNYGLRVLDEPKVTLEYNKSSQQVEIKWEDPDDLATYYPVPLDWAGTIVVRKEGEKPLNRWNGNADGNTLVDSTTRDEYKTTAFVDNTIEQNKRYYYAIMPYHIALDDNDHPIKYYRWTKVFSVDTAKFLVAPTIFPITVIEGTEMTIAYSIPVLESGSYAVQKLVGKKGSIPTSKTDGTVLVDLTPTAGQIVNTVTVTGLDEESTYYFVIFIEDTDGNSASSEPQEARTGVDLGWNFDYTGQIQTFTAPKTGIYSLETWGAQGGDATDGTNSARGGYGAYAYGEVLLTQGETLYINVGGQNGYGGGGNANIVKTFFENGQFNTSLMMDDFDFNSYKEVGVSNGSNLTTAVYQLSQYFRTKYCLFPHWNNSSVSFVIDNNIIKFIGGTAGVYYIPIKRMLNDIPFTKLLAKAKMVNCIDSNATLSIYAVYVDSNNQLQFYGVEQLSGITSDWVNLEVDISQMPYIDYIVLYSNQRGREIWYDDIKIST